jgi:hypothetical protein
MNMNARRVLISVGFLLCYAGVAHAQATRTWVSGVGDDANPCSRTAPCKTWAGAIAKTAAGGEIDALDPGGFGALTITKAITLDGGGGQVASTLVAGTNGIVVAAGQGDAVIIRNIRLDGLGVPGTVVQPGLAGIDVVSAGAVHVEHCSIFGFSNNGISFTPSSLGSLYVSDTTITESGGAGIYITNGHAAIERVVSSGNQSGVIAAASSNVTVSRSIVSGNIMGFAAAYSAASVMEINDSVASHNQWGVVAGQGGTAYLNNASVTDSTISGLLNDGSSFIVSFGNNHLAGNAMNGAFTSMISPM